ncbi:hypothetical protein CVS40_8785 [Lucilia cuprina]|nr:hypothetical protein CVS40_8785 [Lucilia cuprina]
MPSNVRKSINNQKKIISCLQCETPVLESDEAIECDLCKKTLHLLCTKLNKVEIEEVMNDDSLDFKCQFCEPTNDGNAEFKTILKEMKEMKETIKFMSSQYDDILRGVKKNTQNIKSLQKENKNLKDVKKLKSSIAFLNDIRVKNNCIINGIKTEGKSNAVDIVLDIAKKSGAEISEDKIEDAYFIGRKNDKDKSSVVVKFLDHKSKMAFIKEKRKLREMEEMKNVFVNDFLSKESLEVLKHAKSLKTVGFKYIYTIAGKVFVKQMDGSRQIRVRSMDDVDGLLMKFAAGTSKRTYGRSGVYDNIDDEDDDDDKPGACFMSPN